MPDHSRLRVFVSHSSQEDQAVLDAIAAAIRAMPGVTLLMDTEELKPGDAWRARINLWLGACDAAVLVLSEQALTKPWVLYEAAILSYRNRGGDFLIIPVLLNDPEGKLLKDRQLDAPHISEVQAIRKTDPAAIAAGIVAKLTGYQATQKRPIDAAVSRILTILDKLPSHLLENASCKLRLALPWEPGEKPLIPFAERLLGAPIAEAIDAVVELEDFFRKLDVQSVNVLVDLIAASWVDPKAVAELPEIARAASRRAVALNAALAETARMYQVAALPERVRFVSLVDVFAEPYEALADEIVKKVETELRRELKIPANVDVQTQLARADRYVFVAAVPTLGFTDAVIEHLQAKLPSVTFFFLTADHGLPAGALKRNLVKIIIPQLHEKEEAMFNENHQNLLANIWAMNLS